jgi:hypothetical protein
MTLDRAKMILGWMLGWQKLDPTRRASVEDYVALKLSCGRVAAIRQMVKARGVFGAAAWDTAITGQPPVSDGQAKPARPEQPATPVTDKAKQLVTQNLKLLDFLRWLDAKGRLQHLKPWQPDDWVAEYQGLDMDALTAERKAMLDYAAAMQRYWADLEAWRREQAGG